MTQTVIEKDLFSHRTAFGMWFRFARFGIEIDGVHGQDTPVRNVHKWQRCDKGTTGQIPSGQCPQPGLRDCAWTDHKVVTTHTVISQPCIVPVALFNP